MGADLERPPARASAAVSQRVEVQVEVPSNHLHRDEVLEVLAYEVLEALAMPKVPVRVRVRVWVTVRVRVRVRTRVRANLSLSPTLTRTKRWMGLTFWRLAVRRSNLRNDRCRRHRHGRRRNFRRRHLQHRQYLLVRARIRARVRAC